MTKKPSKTTRGNSPLSFGRLVRHLGHFEEFGHFLFLYCKTIGKCLRFYNTTTEQDQTGQKEQNVRKVSQTTKGDSLLSFGKLFGHFGHFDQFGHFLLLYCKTIGMCLCFYNTRIGNDQIGQQCQNDKKVSQTSKGNSPLSFLIFFPFRPC